MNRKRWAESAILLLLSGMISCGGSCSQAGSVSQPEHDAREVASDSPGSPAAAMPTPREPVTREAPSPKERQAVPAAKLQSAKQSRELAGKKSRVKEAGEEVRQQPLAPASALPEDEAKPAEAENLADSAPLIDSGSIEPVTAPGGPSLVIPPPAPRGVGRTGAETVGPGVARMADAGAVVVPDRVTIPEGTSVEIRMAEPLNSARTATGSAFEAVLDRELRLGENEVLPQGTRVVGTAVEAVRSGKAKGRASITLALESIEARGNLWPLRTNQIRLEAEGTTGKDVAKVGAAAAIGAVIGAVAGGGKGALIGGAAGAGAGTTGVLLTRGAEVEVPKERLLSFRLEADAVIGEQP